MSSTQKSKTQPVVNVLRSTMHTYYAEVSEFIIGKYGTSYATSSEIGNAWRRTFPYSDEIKNDLIVFSHRFVALMNVDTAIANNPSFLNKVTDAMADYLSAYTVRGMRQTNDQTPAEMRKAATAQLKKSLYDDCKYIQGKLMRQMYNRARKAYGVPQR